MLVSMCKTYDVDSRARSTHYTSISVRNGRISIVGSRIMLQPIRGSRGLMMRKIQVGERLLLSSSVSSVVSWSTM